MDRFFSGWAAGLGHSNAAFAAIFQSLELVYSAKLLVPVAILFVLWIDNRDEQSRRSVIVGFGGSILALIIARVIQDFAPMRPRPLYSHSFNFVPMSGVVPDWSSFPSDTMAAACAMSTAILMASRKLGIFSFAFSIFVVALCKLITGSHYMSDLLAGGAIGIISTVTCSRFTTILSKVEMICDKIYGVAPRLFYFCIFVISFQYSIFFDDARRLASPSLKAIGIVRESQPDKATPRPGNT